MTIITYGALNTMSMTSKKYQGEWISLAEEQGITESDWVEYQASISAALRPISKRSGTNANTLVCWGDDVVQGADLAIRQDGVMYQGATNIVSQSQVVVNINYGDINEVSYDGVSFYVGNQDTDPSDIAFSSDGMRMFIGGTIGDRIYQYNLSTAWNVSTATYDTSFYVGDRESYVDGLAFKPDGTRMFTSGNTGRRVVQYNLSTPWDIATASYNDNLYTGDTEDGLAFSPDGTRMFTVVINGDEVHQYVLSIPWNVASASKQASVYVGNLDATPDDILFHPEGHKMYYLGISTSKVYQFSLSTPWDIRTASYDNISHYFGNIDGQPDSMVFNPNKTKFYMVGSNTDTVYQFSIPMDVSEERTGVEVDISNFQLSSTPQYVFSGIPTMKVALEDSALRCISRDTPMNIHNVNTDQVQVVYSDVLDQIIAPNDIVVIDSGDIAVNTITDSGATTAPPSFSGGSYSVSSEDTDPQDITFSPDGTRMFLLGAGSDRIHQYTLSTPWDVTLATHVSSVSIASEEGNPKGLTFKPDGTKAYMTGYSTDRVYQYTLLISWDISTLSYDDVSFSVRSQDSTPQHVSFNDDGSRMYVVGIGGDSVYQYNLSTLWDISTAQYTGSSFFFGNQDTIPMSIGFDTGGARMFLLGNNTESLHQYTLSTPWDITSAVYDNSSFSFGLQEPSPQGFSLSPDGSNIYMIGVSTKEIHRYTMESFSLGGDIIWNINLSLGGSTPTFIHIKDRSDEMMYDTTHVYGDVYQYDVSVTTNGSMNHTFDPVDRRQDSGRGIQLGVIGDRGTVVNTLSANLWKT